VQLSLHNAVAQPHPACACLPDCKLQLLQQYVQECQLQEWPAVEAAHDLDAADITTRIAAASVFLRLLRDDAAG
jgi:hypothetical protein